MALKIGSKVRRKNQKEDYYGFIVEQAPGLKGIYHVRFPGGMSAIDIDSLMRYRKRKKKGEN